jgi:hypothetical protein
MQSTLVDHGHGYPMFLTPLLATVSAGGLAARWSVLPPSRR